MKSEHCIFFWGQIVVTITSWGSERSCFSGGRWMEIFCWLRLDCLSHRTMPRFVSISSRYITCLQCKKGRLQLKRGLFRYRNYQKTHDIVKYRSSWADILANLREISMRVFFNAKTSEKIATWSKKTQTICFSWKKFWEATCLTTKLETTNVPIYSTQI